MNIESLKFTESIKPTFSYRILDDNFGDEGKDFKVIGIEIRNESNSLANDIKIEFINTDNVNNIDIPVNLTTVKAKHHKNGDIPIMLGFLFMDRNKRVDHFHFEISYSDIAGQRYIQRIICLHYEGDFKIFPKLPEQN